MRRYKATVYFRSTHNYAVSEFEPKTLCRACRNVLIAIRSAEWLTSAEVGELTNWVALLKHDLQQSYAHGQDLTMVSYEGSSPDVCIELRLEKPSLIKGIRV